MNFMHVAKHVCVHRETLTLIGAKKALRVNIFVQNSSKLHNSISIFYLFYAEWKKGRKVSSMEESCMNFMQNGRILHFSLNIIPLEGGFS